MPSAAAASTLQRTLSVSVDGDCVVQDQLTSDSEKHATSLSQFDHYVVRSRTSHFEDMSLIDFVQDYVMPKEERELTPKRKTAIVIARPSRPSAV